MQIDKPGLYLDIPESDYHADPIVEPSASRSILKILYERTPRHASANHPRLPHFQREDKEDKFSLGTAVHSTILNRGAKIVECPFDSWRTNDSKAMRESAKLAGKVPLLTDQVERVHAMNAAILAQLGDFPELAGAFDPAFGVPESMAAYIDPVAGWTRVLIDWLGKDLAVTDLKTTDIPLSEEKLGRHCDSMGYEWQHAITERALTHLYPELRGRFQMTFLFAETKYPHAIMPIRLPNDAIARGRHHVAEAMRKWAECKAANNWPAFSGEVKTVDYPPWGIAGYDEYMESENV